MINHANKDVSPYSVEYENPLEKQGKLNAIFEGDEQSNIQKKRQRDYSSKEVGNIQHSSIPIDEESNE